MQRAACWSIVGLLLAATLGCGSSVKIYSVTGTVTYKNAPVDGAQVTFTAKEGDVLKPASATTDAQGRFNLKTFFAPGDERTGAMPGLYKVTLQKIPQVQGIVDPYKPGGQPKNELPGKYASALSTPFEKEVTAGTNDFQLDLAD